MCTNNKHKKSLVGIGLKYLSKMSAVLQETVMPRMIEKKKKTEHETDIDLCLLWLKMTSYFFIFFMATFEGQGLHTRSNDRGTKAYHDFYSMY